MILLVPSYYSGWWRGDYYLEEKSQYLECFTLSHTEKCIENVLENDHSWNIINYWAKNNLNVFGKDNFNVQNKIDLEIFEKIWNNDSQLTNALGQIESVNNIPIVNSDSVVIEQPYVVIEGWTVDQSKNQLESVYLLIDDKPFLKHDDFHQRNDLTNLENLSDDVNPGWRISFISGYLDNGCHKIGLAGLNNGEIFLLIQELKICKNN